MTARVEIDPNVRVRRNETFVGFEDVDSAIAVGDSVEVFESESGLSGDGRITQIDEARRLVYLSVAWSSLRIGVPRQKPNREEGAGEHASEARR